MRPVECNYGVEESKILAIVKACKHWLHYLERTIYQVRVVTNYCNLHTFLMSKNLLQHEARWWKRLSGLNLAIEYCPRGKNLGNGPFHCSDYIKLDEDKQVIYIVGYITRSSTKNKHAQNTAKGVQALDSTEVVSEPNQVLENQPTVNENAQSTTQSIQYNDGDIAIDSPVEESEGPTNCPLPSKRRQASTHKQ